VATRVTLNGSGSIGDIEPGWSVSEDCTPAALGDSSGSVGSASVDAASTSSSVFATDNGFQLTDENLGAFSGTVVDARVAGIRASLSVAGRLDVLVGNQTVGPICGSAFYEAGEVTAIQAAINAQHILAHADGSVAYLVGNGTDSVIYHVVDDELSSVTVTGLSGPAGFTYDEVGGYYYIAATLTGARQIHKVSPAGVIAWSSGSNGTGNGQFGTFSNANMLYFHPASNQLFAADYGNNRVQYFNASGTYVGKWAYSLASALTGTSANIYTQDSNCLVTRTSTTGGSPSAIPDLRVSYDGRGIAVSHDGLRLLIASSNSSATESSFLDIHRISDLALIDTRTFDVDIVGIAVGPTYTYVQPQGSPPPTPATLLFVSDTTLRGAFSYYLSLAGINDFAYEASADPTIVVAGWAGDMWSRIKELCAAYSVQMSWFGGKPLVRDIGSVTLAIDNKSVPTVAPSNVFGGRQINIVHQNPKAGAQTMFMADSTYSVDVGQRLSVTVRTNSYPTMLNTPTATDSVPAGSGEYHVIDSNGAGVPAATWTAAGGSVIAVIGYGAGEIDLTFTGPTAAMVGYTGPFKFLETANGAASLSVRGEGVVTRPATLELLTGADEARTTQQVAFTVDSPFIDTIDRAYDRGVWAAKEAAGPSVEVTFTVPTDSLAGFGATGGSIFEYQDSKYRVTQIRYGRVKSQLTGTRYVLAVESDAVWAGQTLGDRDTFWAGYSAGDRTIKPLAS